MPDDMTNHEKLLSKKLICSIIDFINTKNFIIEVFSGLESKGTEGDKLLSEHKSGERIALALVKLLSNYQKECVAYDVSICQFDGSEGYFDSVMLDMGF